MHDGDLRGLKEIVVLHQFMHALEAELDFQQPIRSRRMNGNAVMLIVDADVHRITDVIGDFRIEDRGPEQDVGGDIGRSEGDAEKFGNSCIT